MRNIMETATIKDYLVVRPGGARQVCREAAGARDGASQYAPFSQHGGLGEVHQLFGDKLNTIIEELNEPLAT
ncbi:type I restriction-modification enzyme R subunit C-terminal domain-containing protein [Metallibacterium scheffleri]